MSVSTAPHSHEPPPVTRQRRNVVPASRELDVLLEILSTLGTLTAEGQRHMMSRIVAVLRNHVVSAKLTGRSNCQTLVDLVARLQHQSEHSWPDFAAFREAAESTIVLLKTAVCHQPDVP